MSRERQTERESEKDLLPSWGVRAIKSAVALQGGSWLGIYSLHCPLPCHTQIRSSTRLAIPPAALTRTHTHSAYRHATETLIRSVIWIWFMSEIYIRIASDNLCSLLIDSSVTLCFSRVGKVKRKSVCPQTPAALITTSVLISPFRDRHRHMPGGHSGASTDFQPHTDVDTGRYEHLRVWLRYKECSSRT